MTDEDLIESLHRPPPQWQRRVRALLRHPAAAVSLLLLGLLAGSVGGFVVGQGNPRTLAGPGYFYGPPLSPFEQGDPFAPFEQTYGRAQPPLLTGQDMVALGESVRREISILSGQSAIPALCSASLGQPAPNSLGLSYPATQFGVDGGDITELIWPRPDEGAASGTLRTFVVQAQACPDVTGIETGTITTGGVATGIGDEYAIFTREPPASGPPGGFYMTVILVRVGADLIEITFTSAPDAVPLAEARCLRVAAAAAAKAIGG